MFLKADLKKSDDQTNICKYRVAVNNSNYNIVYNYSYIESSIQRFIFMAKFCHFQIIRDF